MSNYRSIWLIAQPITGLLRTGPSDQQIGRPPDIEIRNHRYAQSEHHITRGYADARPDR